MRPAFLTVLCVLTFLWNSHKLYTSVKGYQNAETTIQTMEPVMEQVREQMTKDFTEEQEAEMDKMMLTMKDTFIASNIRIASIFTVISAILLILGGIWMWDLKKKGFWTYIAGNAVGVLAPMIIFSGLIGTTIGIMCAVLALIFIGLYAINLKSLA